MPVDAELLDAAGPSLRVVANFAVGYDNVDLEACRERGVIVTNTPDVLTNATAELTVALMLAAARRLGEAERMLRAGDWRGWDPGQLLGRELAECRIGIVGLGRIGQRVAELLQRLRRRACLLVADPPARDRGALGASSTWSSTSCWPARTSSRCTSRSTDETRHLIDAAALERFKPGAILVNTARGGLVDTAALVEALREGRLAGAGLDVYENEPEVPAELLELENVVLVPHIGSATGRARDAMATLAARNVVAVLEGGSRSRRWSAGRARSAANVLDEMPLGTSSPPTLSANAATGSSEAHECCDKRAATAKNANLRFARSEQCVPLVVARRRASPCRPRMSYSPPDTVSTAAQPVAEQAEVSAAVRRPKKPRCDDCFFDANSLCALREKKPARRSARRTPTGCGRRSSCRSSSGRSGAASRLPSRPRRRTSKRVALPAAGHRAPRPRNERDASHTSRRHRTALVAEFT